MKAAKRRVVLMWGQYDLESKPVAVMFSSPWNRDYWAKTLPYKRYRDHDKQERNAYRRKK